MKLRFNPSKDFAVVTPPLNGAIHHQVASDGVGYYFNGNGEPIDLDTGEKLEKDIKAPEPEMVKSEVVTVDADGTQTVEVVETPAPDQKDAREELMKYLRGEEDADRSWVTQRKYAKEIFGKIPSGKDELISLAIEKDFIKADQVKEG